LSDKILGSSYSRWVHYFDSLVDSHIAVGLQRSNRYGRKSLTWLNCFDREKHLGILETSTLRSDANSGNVCVYLLVYFVHVIVMT